MIAAVRLERYTIGRAHQKRGVKRALQSDQCVEGVENSHCETPLTPSIRSNVTRRSGKGRRDPVSDIGENIAHVNRSNGRGSTEMSMAVRRHHHGEANSR